MYNSFSDFIFKFSPMTPLLPVMHTTGGFDFRKILVNCELKPSYCKVFKESLLYLFYGRPAYRVSEKIKSTSQTMHYPVCFLLTPDCFKKAVRVFPFDTGGFENRLFKDYMHDNMNIKDFIIDQTQSNLLNISEIPASIVSAFYENNYNYYRGKPKDSIKLLPLDFEVTSFYQLIKTENQTNFDDRCFSIEIQIDSRIKLSADTVKAVVLPTSFIDLPEVKNIIAKKWGAELLDYESYHADPSAFTVVVMEKVRNFLKSEDLI